jgi:hypothetical protein
MGNSITRAGCLRHLQLILAITGLSIPFACGQHKAELRIYNAGSLPIERVTVYFPKDHVTFADVGPNVVTAYQEVPHGIGRDASFRFVVNGAPIEQYVVDFVGWRPIPGMAFTYRVRIEPGESRPLLRVVEVVREK